MLNPLEVMAALVRDHLRPSTFPVMISGGRLLGDLARSVPREKPAMELLYRDFKREDFEIFARSTIPQRTP